MITLLLATRNPKKARELRRLLGGRYRVLTLDRFPDVPAVVEDGRTFRANAVKKAVQTSRHTILPVLADDSGLEVRALKGEPGVHSARFAGSAQRDLANNAKLLRQMEKIPPSRRQARFVCWIALALGGRLIRTFQGECAGAMAFSPSGKTGFGYDPIFIPRGMKKSFAQLGGRTKDRMSHRARAIAQLRDFLLKTDPSTGPAG